MCVMMDGNSSSGDESHSMMSSLHFKSRNWGPNPIPIPTEFDAISHTDNTQEFNFNFTHYYIIWSFTILEFGFYNFFFYLSSTILFNHCCTSLAILTFYTECVDREMLKQLVLDCIKLMHPWCINSLSVFICERKVR